MPSPSHCPQTLTLTPWARITSPDGPGPVVILRLEATSVGPSGPTWAQWTALSHGGQPRPYRRSAFPSRRAHFGDAVVAACGPESPPPPPSWLTLPRVPLRAQPPPPPPLPHAQSTSPLHGRVVHRPHVLAPMSNAHAPPQGNAALLASADHFLLPGGPPTGRART